jgi:hypothetical protein
MYAELFFMVLLFLLQLLDVEERGKLRADEKLHEKISRLRECSACSPRFLNHRSRGARLAVVWRRMCDI